MLLLQTRWQHGHKLAHMLARHAVAACIQSSPATSAFQPTYSTKPPAEQLDRLVDAIVDAANKRRTNARAKAIDVASIVDAVLAPAIKVVADKPIQRVDHMFTEPQNEQDRVPRGMQHLLKAALVGAPNSGKSTLTNKLTGCKVSAVSHKTNTTVETMLGSFTTGLTQVVLFDTPGLVTKQHYRRHKHGPRIRSAWATATTCNLVVFVVDAARQVQKPDPRVMRLVENIATLGTGAKKHQQHALPDPSMTTQGRAAAHEHIIDVGSRTHGQQHGQQLQGASSSAALAKHKASPLTDGRLTAGQTALTDGQTEFVDAETERVMEALESILRGGITIADMRDEDGDGDDDAMDGDEDDVDRAALTRALEDLLGVEEEEDDSDEEKHTDWEEDDNDIENHNNDNHQVHNDEDQDTHQRPHASTNTPHRPTPPHNALTVDVVPTPPGAPRVPHMTMKNLSDLELLSDTHSGHQLTDILRQRKHKALAERKPQEGTLAQEICPPCILLMNKMDLLSRREKLLALRWANEMMKLHNFEDVFYISAERNSGLKELKDFLLGRAERGEWLLAEGQATDANPAELVQELVREAVYTFLHQELPYTTEVVHIKWEFQQGGTALCHQHILVKNKHQHSIVVGTRGAMINRITRKARGEAEKVLGIHLNLVLSVKVLPKHLQSEQHMQRVGGGHVGW